MSNLQTLINRNQDFKNQFGHSDLPILPKLRTVILTCADSRVDPAHIFDLGLGDSVVIRNTGGRVTQETIDEIASYAFMSAMMDKSKGVQEPFEVVILHHTQCGAERFANPELQKALKNKTGVDVASIAIHDHEESMAEDLNRLIDAKKELPDHIIVSGSIYDVKTGGVETTINPSTLEDLRRATPNE
ncbi:hypothetical protein GTQ34_07385 [Muricauda sp. JGD-17]|uniref:carbonic anhydrase n=1 Tax=Flagellimonas ochracea TaxID=2696472 RepID=A0A964WXM0_9FLAO|nr:carbonic anhydrase [Allomuricauda ochracea]NAY91734.1 hypothetical protein [Allomuricauda ochracea]